MEAIQDLLGFLEKSARFDLKIVALDHVLCLTGSPDGLGLLKNLPTLVDLLLALTEDASNSVAKDAALALINISACPDSAKKWLSLRAQERMSKLWRRIESDDQVVDNKEGQRRAVADPCCMVLSNLSIDIENAEVVWTSLVQSGVTMARFVELLCQRQPDGPDRHYLATALSNLSQIRAVRETLLSRTNPLLSTLLIFTEHGNLKRRGGIIGMLRNCTFDTVHHEWMLETVDILPRLLLPLAGPTPEDLDEEEVDKLPIELQYLDDDKKVEQDPDIRKLLLDALLQLCATKKGREFLRSKNAYVILRELHKHEKDKVVLLACENVIDILIKKEAEINVENYHEHEVPEEVIPQLVAMDEDYLKD